MKAQDSQSDYETDKAYSSGLSLGLGVGHQDSGIGVHVLYYFQLPSELWRVVPHVAAGTILGGKGISGGLMTAFGHHHRLVLDIGVGPLGGRGGDGEPTVFYYGVYALVGWEWMSSFGLAVRAGIGAGYLPSLAGVAENILAPSVQLLAVDYKVW